MQKPSPRLVDVALAVLVAALTALLHTAAFPFAFVGGKLLCMSEAGYIFLVPLAIWLMKPRKLRTTLGVAGGAFWASWLVLLWWLRHVTLAGTVALALIVALFPVAWALAARWALPWLGRRGARERIFVICGLAGLWVLLEWVRSWIFSGFPWLPLAASQWNRPALLQILPFTGYLGLSWVLAYFNLALASYALTLVRPRRDMAWWHRLNPELYTALFMVLACAFSVLPIMRGHGQSEKLFSAGIVQPYVPGSLKWDQSMAQDNILRLERLSRFAAMQGAQVVFWPESSTPWPVVSPNPIMRQWTEQLCAALAVPVVMGNMADETLPDGKEVFYNGVFAVDPQKGLNDVYYTKRHLVPFGEYNPLSWLTDNFIDLPYNFFTPGKSPTILSVAVPGGRTYRLGSMLCYEDIFPALARDEVMKGADFLFVATNNAWYGEEAGAYQHAVHSILRAVENRRPVLRCGNGGWSGLIDEYGNIRRICDRPGNGIYYEGEDVFPMLRNPGWEGVLTFYTRHGDWFVVVAALMVLRAAWIARKGATFRKGLLEQLQKSYKIPR